MTNDVTDLLRESGMSEAEAARKQVLIAQCQGAPGLRGNRSARHWLFVPGRIEFLGKHTDYAGGRSLVCAVERGICAVVAPRADATLSVTDTDHLAQERIAFELDPDLKPAHGHWSNYPMTVARRVARNFGGPLRGADVALASDLPRAAGMSSSSALVVATFLALSQVNELRLRPEYAANIRMREDLAGYLGCIENGGTFGTLAGDHGVGTFGGSEDHTAIVCGRAGALGQYRYSPVTHERDVPLPRELVFAVGVSGVAAEKTGAARERYNRASRLASQVLQRWHARTGRNDATLAAALRSAPGAADDLRAMLHQLPADETRDLLNRFDHFAAESEVIVPAAGDALIAGDLPRLGELVHESQSLAERLLGNQVPETVELVRLARACGAVAASAFGAGFGGSVWALVDDAGANAFLAAWRDAYVRAFPRRAEASAFFTSRPGPAAICR